MKIKKLVKKLRQLGKKHQCNLICLLFNDGSINIIEDCDAGRPKGPFQDFHITDDEIERLKIKVYKTNHAGESYNE